MEMKIKCFQLSSTGVVREHNEDFIAFWEPEKFQLQQEMGGIAVLADGVGGEGNGELASQMAAETALAIFREAKPETSPNDLVRAIYTEAAAKIFQAAQAKGRMS